MGSSMIVSKSKDFPDLNSETLETTLRVLAHKFKELNESIGKLMAEFDEAVKPFPQEEYMEAATDEERERIKDDYEDDPALQQYRAWFKGQIDTTFEQLINLREELMEVLKNSDYAYQFSKIHCYEAHLYLLIDREKAKRLKKEKEAVA